MWSLNIRFSVIWHFIMLPDRTSSTRPKPPTPSVSMMLKSVSFRLEKKAFSASYLQVQNTAVPSLNTGKQNFKRFHISQIIFHQVKMILKKFFNQMPAPAWRHILPAAFDHMEERELLGGLDGEGGDGEGGRGGRGRSREAGNPLSLLPHWDWKQLSHLQTLFNPQIWTRQISQLG